MTAPTTPEHGLTPGVLGVTASQDDIDRTVAALWRGWVAMLALVALVAVAL